MRTAHNTPTEHRYIGLSANRHKINAINYIRRNRKYIYECILMAYLTLIADDKSSIKCRNKVKRNFLYNGAVNIHLTRRISIYMPEDRSHTDISIHFTTRFGGIIRVCKRNWQFVSYKSIINYTRCRYGVTPRAHSSLFISIVCVRGVYTILFCSRFQTNILGIIIIIAMWGGGESTRLTWHA